jgi:hypothetical protein
MPQKPEEGLVNIQPASRPDLEPPADSNIAAINNATSDKAKVALTNGEQASLEVISAKKVRELAKGKQNLDLSNYTLDANSAKALPSNLRELRIGNRTLDVNTARAFRRDNLLSLYLPNLTQLDVEVAKALPRWLEGLSLPNLKHASLDIVRSLPQSLEWLDLDRADGINVDIVSALPRSIIYLAINSKTFDTAMASSLPPKLRSFTVYKLTNTDPETVKAFPGTLKVICLNDLLRLDAETASALPRNIQFLNLTSLPAISANVIKALPDVSYELQLSGLKSVNHECFLLLRNSWLNGDTLLNETVDDIFSTFELKNKEPEKEVEVIEEWKPLFEKTPNFKDIVWHEAGTMQCYLKENGIANPERFHNLNAARGGEAFVTEAIQFLQKQPDRFGIGAYAELFRNRTRKHFNPDPSFITVYMDETLQTLYDFLNCMVNSIKKLSDSEERNKAEAFLISKLNDPHLDNRIRKRYQRDLQKLNNPPACDDKEKTRSDLKTINELLAKMRSFHLIRKGEVSYRLGSRSRSDLSLGDKCSDCTSASISGINYWTVPVWLTDPGFNFLLQYDEEGKLAHKFGLVWEVELKNGKQYPVLTIDSLELANEQKKKAGMSEMPADEDKEKGLTDQAINYVQEWCVAMGLDSKRLYAAPQSNTGTAELSGYKEREVVVSKLGGLEGPQHILETSNPEYKGKVKAYFQSLQTEQGNTENNAENAGEGANDEMFGIQQGDKSQDYRTVETCLDLFLRSDSKDIPIIRKFMELARTDSAEAARQMRIFLITQALPATKKSLAIGSQRIDVFLSSRGHTLEGYLKTILGHTEINRGSFVKTKLLHLQPCQKA